MAFIVCLEVHETHSLSSLNRLSRQSKHASPCAALPSSNLTRINKTQEAFVDFVTIFFSENRLVFSSASFPSQLLS